MQSLTVKDLMVPTGEYATISADGTLSDAALALYEAQLKELSFDPGRHRDRAVLVIDANDQVLGKLSMLDVLRGLETRYDRVEGARASSRAASRIGSARLMIESMGKDVGLWKKPLTDLVENARNIPVRHLLRPIADGEAISEEASIDEALHQLIVGRFQSLLVTHEGQIIGVIRLTDVYEEISKLLRSANTE